MPDRIILNIDAIEAPAGRTYTELRTTLQFLDGADKTAFVNHLGLGVTTGNTHLTGITGLTGGGAAKLDGKDMTLYGEGESVTFKVADAHYRYRVADTGTLPSESLPTRILSDAANGTKFWLLVEYSTEDHASLTTNFGSRNLQTTGTFNGLSISASNGTLSIYPTETIRFNGGFEFLPTTLGDNFILRIPAGSADLTFPLAGTVATTAGTETLTNKTINFSSNTFIFTSVQLRVACTDDTGTGALFFAGGNAGAFTGTSLTLSSTLTAGGPIVCGTYTVSTVPSASTYARGLIYVSNETGGATIAFSDGTNWRRVQDRNVVS